MVPGRQSHLQLGDPAEFFPDSQYRQRGDNAAHIRQIQYARQRVFRRTCLLHLARRMSLPRLLGPDVLSYRRIRETEHRSKGHRRYLEQAVQGNVDKIAF